MSSIPPDQLIDSGPRPNKAIITFPEGKGEVFTRLLAALFPLIEVVLLSIALGFNNSSSANDFPQNVANCSNIGDLYLYSSSFLIRSINIFNGLWLAFCCLAVLYQSFIILIRFLNFGFVNINFRKFVRVDIAINSFFMWVFIGGIAGCFMTGFLWGAYRNGSQVQGSAATTASVISGVQYAAFGFFIACVSQYYSAVLNMIFFDSKQLNRKVVHYTTQSSSKGIRM